MGLANQHIQVHQEQQLEPLGLRLSANLAANDGFASAGPRHDGNAPMALAHLDIQVINELHLIGAQLRGRRPSLQVHHTRPPHSTGGDRAL